MNVKSMPQAHAPTLMLAVYSNCRGVWILMYVRVGGICHVSADPVGCSYVRKRGRTTRRTRAWGKRTMMNKGRDAAPSRA